MTTQDKINALIPYITNDFMQSDVEYDYSLSLNLWQLLEATEVNIKLFQSKQPNNEKYFICARKYHEFDWLPSYMFIQTETTVERGDKPLHVDICIGYNDLTLPKYKDVHCDIDELLDMGILFLKELNK